MLVWNVTEGEAGVADQKPWLNSISVRAPDSCIIVVGTFLDKVSEEDQQSGKINELLRKVEELTRQYRRLVVTNITVVGLKGRMENVAKLKDYIYNAAAEYKIKGWYVMGHKIPSSYHALDNKLSTIHHLVKQGHHEPIMHAVEFQKMVRDLNLFDIQDDDELRTATHFLHEVGALLHYDDPKHNLDDLFFVDPHWLCDLLSTVVTVKQQNPYVKQGILRSKNITLLFKDKRFPNRYFNQYLTLLNRFEIALPLDKNHKRILIPSILPEKRPDVVAEQQLNDKSCYKRFILFRPSIVVGQAYRHPTPPGFWSRLLSHIMNTVKEVRNIINEHVPVEEEDLVISSNLLHLPNSSYTTNLFNSDSKDQLCPVTETVLMFETHSVIFGDSNALEGPLENNGMQPPTSSSTALTSETLSVNCSNFVDPDTDKSRVPSPMSSSPTTSESNLSTTKSTVSSEDPINDNTKIELMSEKPSIYCNVFGEPKVDTSTMLSSKSVIPTSSESLLRTTTTTPHEYTVDPITENGLISETYTYCIVFGKTPECDRPTIPSPGLSSPTVLESPLTYGPQCQQSQGGLLEVFPIKGEQSEQSEDPLDTVIENGLMSETSAMICGYSNTFEGPFECDRSTTQPSLSSSPGILESPSILGSRHPSHEQSQGGSLEVLPIEGGGNLVYWRTGLFYNVNKLTFVIESLAELKRYQDKDGVLILASQGAEGCKILGQLIDIVEQLICEWYPGLNGELEQKVPCIECTKCGVPSPHEFKVDQLLPLMLITS